MASNIQESIHFRQPVQSLELNISTCLLIRVLAIYKNDLSMTLLGQASMHFQQAVHDCMFNWTNAVCAVLFLRRVDFILFGILN